ncbi:MAG TPA: hypothetical protein VN807_02800 [Candidatus Sulfotelmatobacter sp.]|nr:hypothetical protein [Candidatus Sulfotelmatobacter sp.]
MNFTLSLDEKLVKEVRKMVVERDTTLTGLVREYLENSLARQRVANGANEKPSRALSRNTISISGGEHGSGRTYMTAPEFMDSNIVLYAYERCAKAKDRSAVAEEGLGGGMLRFRTGAGRSFCDTLA